jgi:hypothetical protein
MKLSAFKSQLQQLDTLTFVQSDGQLVPAHFHVTEVGQITRNFIDCGGTVRKETAVNFQLWEAGDYDHRLAPQKLLNIIALSEKTLGITDEEIEVEYQGSTIGRYDLVFNNNAFHLLAKRTNCLASDKCGIPPEKLKVKLQDLSPVGTTQGCCTPGSGCC